jgi:hypothetical protein
MMQEQRCNGKTQGGDPIEQLQWPAAPDPLMGRSPAITSADSA